MGADSFEPLDEFNYHARLRITPGMALVLFGSPQCGACRRAEWLLPGAMPDDARLFRIDVREAVALARAFDVFHLPALFLYLDGHYHARLDCEITPSALRHRLAEALAAPAEDEP